MRIPANHTADAIKDMSDLSESNTPTINDRTKNYWFLTRPLPYDWGFIGNIKKRFQYAWLVFSGKADVVTWIDQ